MACMKCGGMKKSGGTTSAVKKIKMKAGGFAAGIPYKIGAGSTDGGSSPTGMMKRGGVKKPVLKKAMYGTTMMKKGGDPGDGWKNLLKFGAAGALIGAFTTEEGIARRAKKAEARHEKRLIKKGLPIEKPKSFREMYDSKGNKISKFGGGVNKK